MDGLLAQAGRGFCILVTHKFGLQFPRRDPGYARRHAEQSNALSSAFRHVAHGSGTLPGRKLSWLSRWPGGWAPGSSWLFPAVIPSRPGLRDNPSQRRAHARKFLPGFALHRAALCAGPFLCQLDDCIERPPASFQNGLKSSQVSLIQWLRNRRKGQVPVHHNPSWHCLSSVPRR